MRKINPIWLWYSVVLLFPPVHELGHYCIGLATGMHATRLCWNVVYWSDSSGMFYQNIWEWSPLVFLGCGLLSIYLWGRSHPVHTRVYCGVGKL